MLSCQPSRSPTPNAVAFRLPSAHKPSLGLYHPCPCGIYPTSSLSDHVFPPHERCTPLEQGGGLSSPLPWPYYTLHHTAQQHAKLHSQRETPTRFSIGHRGDVGVDGARRRKPHRAAGAFALHRPKMRADLREGLRVVVRSGEMPTSMSAQALSCLSCTCTCSVSLLIVSVSMGQLQLEVGPVLERHKLDLKACLLAQLVVGAVRVLLALCAGGTAAGGIQSAAVARRNRVWIGPG